MIEKEAITQVHELETDRLRLRAWCDSDLAPFARLNADRLVMEYFPKPLTPTESDAFAHKISEWLEIQGWGFWAVSRKKAPRKKKSPTIPDFIGCVGLNRPQMTLPFGPCVEVGWRLSRQAWGRGFATEAAHECLRFAFEELKLPEVVSFTAVINQKSEAVMQRLGMVNQQANFMHPKLPEDSPLREHVLYRMTQAQWHEQLKKTSC